MTTNIDMIKGDTMSFGLEIEGLDQSLASAYFSVRDSLSSDAYIFQKSIGDGITEAETGRYVIRIAPEDTQNLSAGRYFYDFEVGVNNDVFTLLIGMLTIEDEVTIHNE